MKAYIQEIPQNAKFEPFEFVINVETIKEARGLWHLLNFTQEDIEKFYEEEEIVEYSLPFEVASTEVFDILDRELDRQNIKI